MAEGRLRRILAHTVSDRNSSSSSSSPSSSSASKLWRASKSAVATCGAATVLQGQKQPTQCGCDDEALVVDSSSLGPGAGVSMEEAGIDSNASAQNVSSSREDNSWPIGPVAEDCIFCKIVHGYEPAFKLYEDDLCICILDKNPLCYGHCLLVPKGHFPSLHLTPPRIAAAMCGVVPVISNVIMQATSSDAFNLVVNSGEAAGQVVFHTHFHIVPRFAGDGLWTNESVHRRPLSTFKDPTQLMRVIRAKLAEHSTQGNQQ